MLTDAAQREASRAHVATLLRNHHLPPPDAATTHVLIDLGAFHLRWELHTEFVCWTFSKPMSQAGMDDVREPEAAIDYVPRDWLAALPGQCLSGLHLWALQEQEVNEPHLVRHLLQEDTLVGEVLAVAADITTEEGRAAVLSAAGGPGVDFDIVVTNAGGPPPGDFRDWDRAAWLKAVDANMLTPIELIKATVDGMAARGFGRIVNITSSAVKAPIDILGLSNGARSASRALWRAWRAAALRPRA
ncbi:Retinol dehydrogenase 8 [Manis javanica]|nr:Retinol dehydrogenase 8 [Manis javanica]